MRLSRARRRTGFTLVEMLVATALILFIMAIMAEALGAGSKTFSNMRTAGDLQNKLRGASTIMRRDLSQEHFGPPYGTNRGGPRLRDQRLDQPGWRPPFAGYFEIVQINPSNYEPTLQPDQNEPPAVPLPPATAIADAEGLYSTRARNHRLKFTIRLPDGPPSELMAAAYHPRLSADPKVNAFPALAPMVYTRWAEVHYYLSATPNLTPGGLPLQTLRRRVRLLPPQTQTIVVSAGEAAQIQNDMNNLRYPDIIDPILMPAPSPPFAAGSVLATVPGPELINAVDDPSVDNNLSPSLRIWDPNDPSGRAIHPTGDDILLQDVISFEVKAAWFYNPSFNLPSTAGGTGFFLNHPIYGPLGPSMPPHQAAVGNTDEPFSDLRPSVLVPPSALITAPVRRFDTGFRTKRNQAFMAPSPPNPPDAFEPDWDNTGPTTGGFLAPGLGTQPARINVRVLQIKLRIWDPRAEQARQVTIIQEV